MYTMGPIYYGPPEYFHAAIDFSILPPACNDRVHMSGLKFPDEFYHC